VSAVTDIGRPWDPIAPDHLPGRRPGRLRRFASRPRSWLGGRSLRNRMVLLVGVAVTAAVALVAVIALTATRIFLFRSIDGQLLGQARAMAGAEGRRDLGDSQPGNPYNEQYLDSTGTFHFTPPSPNGTASAALPVDAGDRAVAAGTSEYHFHSVTVGGVHLRVVTVELQRPLQVVVNDVPYGPLVNTLQVGRPLNDVDSTLRELALLLGLVGALGVGGSVLLGRLVARAALKPVDAAVDAAERVARTQDLSALIPVHGTDEIARLAQSLNSMLRALEASRVRQRQLVDDASHELRTPLTSLRTNIELLLRAEANPARSLPPADRAALLADVGAQMQEMTGLVSELVALARDDGKPEEVVRVDLAEVVRSASDRVRLRAKDVTITVFAVPSPVDGRPNVLERAVTNLLDNAVKFSPPGGEVRVAVAGGEVAVADEGPGIDEADRLHVFDRFYRATSARGLPGSGLGLAIVADAAAQHGGSVRADAAPSGGALMHFAVPPAAGADPPRGGQPQLHPAGRDTAGPFG
jgi:two-component system, OmpR family, sensor histidine kinase MprB